MTKTENKNWIFWLIIFGFFSISVYALRSVLLPFVAGIIIGYLLDPLVTKFEKMKLSRTLSTCIVLLIVQQLIQQYLRDNCHLQ